MAWFAQYQCTKCGQVPTSLVRQFSGQRAFFRSMISFYVYDVHGGPTGMVVANMAVDGPFFQPANVEDTGSHHSWL